MMNKGVSLLRVCHQNRFCRSWIVAVIPGCPEEGRSELVQVCGCVVFIRTLLGRHSDPNLDLRVWSVSVIISH